MKTWERARREQRCGRCGGRILRGELMLLLRYHVGTFVKVRCGKFECCGEAMPTNLPELEALPEPKALPPAFTKASSTASMRELAQRLPFASRVLAFDAKARAAGEREPGEEG
jgi:hypothetical protein